MKAQMLVVLVLAVVLAAMVLTVSCASYEDTKCRQIASSLKMDQQLVDKVPKFLLFGPPKHPQTCAEKCNSEGMNIGFDFFGLQACCCGVVIAQ